MLEKFNNSDLNFNLLNLIKDKVIESNNKAYEDIKHKNIPFGEVK